MPSLCVQGSPRKVYGLIVDCTYTEAKRIPAWLGSSCHPDLKPLNQALQLRGLRVPETCIPASETQLFMVLQAGSTFGWIKWTGPKGKTIGIDHFGASGPAPALYEWAGITTAKVVEAAS